MFLCNKSCSFTDTKFQIESNIVFNQHTKMNYLIISILKHTSFMRRTPMEKQWIYIIIKLMFCGLNEDLLRWCNVQEDKKSPLLSGKTHIAIAKQKLPNHRKWTEITSKEVQVCSSIYFALTYDGFFVNNFVHKAMFNNFEYLYRQLISFVYLWNI